MDYKDLVVNRLVKADNQLKVAKVSLYSEKINWIYLAIDNILTGLIILKEKKDPKIYNHAEKIKRIQGCYPDSNIISSDFKLDTGCSDIFDQLCKYNTLWNTARYENRLPNIEDIFRMEELLFLIRAYAFKEVSKEFGIKKEDLCLDIEQKSMTELFEIPQETFAEYHEYRQMKLEHLGEISGKKLGMKLSNITNLIHVLSQTDDEWVKKLIHDDEEIESLMIDIFSNYVKMIEKLQEKYFIMNSIEDYKKNPEFFSEENNIKKFIEDTINKGTDFRHSFFISYQGYTIDKIVEKYSKLIKRALEDIKSK